mmetsp:Transcript_8601/g.18565  ORF Transcript_8601/g.18565 Transcript_8601/m.18565 type:complete len:525 (+) Transcript_8601:72-1646(+)
MQMAASRVMSLPAWLTVAAIVFCISDFRHQALAFQVPRGSSKYRSATVGRPWKSPSTILLSSEQTNTNNNDSDGDFSFFDEATIYVRAGSGGQGSSTYKKAKKGANGIPDGGSGGLGGNVVLKLDQSLNTLAGLSKRTLRPNAFGGGGAAASSKRMGDKQGAGMNVQENNFVARERLLSFRAEDGKTGGRMYDNGRGGEDCEVLVAPGTVVQLEVERETEEGEEATSNTTTGENDEQYDLVELGTVSYENPTLIVARGGRGGEGTATLKGKKRGATRRGPDGGERCRLRLTLKIVADIALVGVPNAGKSTFLAAVTRAKPRIADYPFTTVVPNLGTWIPPDDKKDSSHYSNFNKDGSKKGDRANRAAGSSGLVLCDVPGLIAGASEGIGLGHAFLRHIERCRVILHLVDATGEDPVGDLAMVNDELKRYGSGSLANKPQVVIVNKIDAAFGEIEEEEIVNEKKMELANQMKEEMGHTRLMWVSAKEKDGVDDLMTRMASYVGKMKEEEEEKQREIDAADATTVV